MVLSYIFDAAVCGSRHKILAYILPQEPKYLHDKFNSN